MITVVAAVIEVNDTFLLTRRQTGAHLEGLWEFPGGKINPDETHEAALKREIREELDADVEVGELMFHTVHVYPEITAALFFYRCVLTSAPRPRLSQEMQWVPRAELPLLGLPPADRGLVEILTG